MSKRKVVGFIITASSIAIAGGACYLFLVPAQSIWSLGPKPVRVPHAVIQQYVTRMSLQAHGNIKLLSGVYYKLDGFERVSIRLEFGGRNSSVRPAGRGWKEGEGDIFLPFPKKLMPSDWSEIHETPVSRYYREVGVWGERHALGLWKTNEGVTAIITSASGEKQLNITSFFYRYGRRVPRPKEIGLRDFETAMQVYCVPDQKKAAEVGGAVP